MPADHRTHQTRVDAPILNAGAEPPRSPNVATVNAFLDRLQANDTAGFLELWAEEARQDMPYAPPDFPNSLPTKQAVTEQYSQLPTLFERQRYYDREFFTTQDPHVVIARFRGDLKLAGRDMKYDNRYFNVFVFDDAGKIVRAIEHFNPLVLMDGKPFEGGGA